MDLRRVPVLDRTLSVLSDGYTWLPGRWRRTNGPVVRTRLLGKHTVVLRGPEAVRFFYDERHVHRHGAMPEPVLSTLFGHGGVQTLDGETHRTRKAMFMSLLTDPARVARLVEEVTEEWDKAVFSWPERSRVVLFDEASRVLARGVCRWAGVPLDEPEVAEVARDLVALVDGFATAGPRHWRARSARRRREAWLARLVEDVREGTVEVPERSVIDVVTRHRDADGQLLDPGHAAVELLNIVRPTVAVSWFFAFAAHALHRWPQQVRRLREEDPAYARAFIDELRRFYPMAPFLGGSATKDLTWYGQPIPAGAMVLLDVYGPHHHGREWSDSYSFDPGRFLDRPAGRDELIPQGCGDPYTGHRCPGEDITTALLQALVTRLARLDYEVPEQDLTISLRRMPARPRSGVVISDVRVPAERSGRDHRDRAPDAPGTEGG